MTTPTPPEPPLCLVWVPSARKPGNGAAAIDGDAVYRDLIAPAVVAAGMTPLRADADPAGGASLRPTVERLILCEYAVADLSGANANLFHALGRRDGVRPSSTVLLSTVAAAPAPFDADLLRALPYRCAADGRPADAAADAVAITARLRAMRERASRSTVYAMVDDFHGLQRLKTDVFRDRVDYAPDMKARLHDARTAGLPALRAIEAELAAAPGGMADADAAVVIDLFLSYRALKGWAEMLALVPRLAAPLAATTMVQEQLGFALNRAGRPDEADAVLTAVIAKHGASSETHSLLGRVHKDRWEAALAAGDAVGAAAWLTRAIDTYLQGFEADWRDAFPGINSVTLMALQEPPDARGAALVPIVAYAVGRRIAGGQPDYWDHATLIELAVLARDRTAAEAALANALAAVREVWEPETTARNLRLIAAARARRGERVAWVDDVLAALDRRAGAAA